MSAVGGHSVPLHCPYCAGENLHPHGDAHGAWECRECLRAFSVKFVGLLSPQHSADDSPQSSAAHPTRSPNIRRTP
jgi:transposase-like protein